MVFAAAGVSAPEEAVYLHLLRHGSLGVEELATRLRLSPQRVQRLVSALQGKGLVHRTPAPEHLVVAVPLELAVDQLIQRRRDELDQVRQAAQRLAEELTHRPANRSPTELVEVVQGRAAVAQAYERVQHVARHTVRTLVAPPYAADWRINRTELNRLDDGVGFQAVYGREALTEPGFTATVAVHALAGEEIRLIDTVPIKLAIADETLALVPLSWTMEAQDSAILVHPSGMLHALMALFDSVWAQATPFAVDDAGEVAEAELGPDDRQLLSLLVAGYTDEAAGGRVGMSRRTVVRRVQHMMSLTGARSRLQLGWYARQRGWL